MSGSEKIAKASEARRGLSESAQRIAKMRDDAIRANEDAAQIQCLDDAASSVNGFLTVAKNSYESLQVRSEETRLNSSHVAISYAVFCLKKKKKKKKKKKTPKKNNNK